jgi:hypothetical protein
VPDFGTCQSPAHASFPSSTFASFRSVVSNPSVNHGRNIIAIFGQWGAIQLLLAGLLWVLVLRYRELTPLILCVE